MFVFSACSTARCHRSVTRTTTVLLTRRASSTHTTLHSTPARPTLFMTAPGPGGAPTSAPSSKRLGVTWWDHRHRVQCSVNSQLCCISMHTFTLFDVETIHNELWRWTTNTWPFKRCFVNFAQWRRIFPDLEKPSPYSRGSLQTASFPLIRAESLRSAGSARNTEKETDCEDSNLCDPCELSSPAVVSVVRPLTLLSLLCCEVNHIMQLLSHQIWSTDLLIGCDISDRLADLFIHT